MGDENPEEMQDEIDELAELVDELVKDVDVIEDDVEDIEEELDEEERGKRRVYGATPRKRSAALRAVRSSLSTRNASPMTKKDAQIRSAFANFVVGKINESEARSLGIEVGNGSVTIPKVIASEVITYAQEENLLRKYGTVVQTKDTQGYPILVKKADANINKGERSTNIAETEIEFDEVTLNPAEFDALATVTKKLLARADVPVEDIVVDELKKAYVRKETNYMFNGDDKGHENPGALAKKAVAFYENPGDDLYDSLVKLKNTPVTEVVKAARWIINRAALTLIETMKTADGFPLLRPFEAPEGGIKHTLLGYEFDFTDDADAADPTKAVFYFGDFSQFRIQDVIGSMEIQRLVEAYSAQNKVGFQIYNVVDGQLIYSPLAPAVYRYEVGATVPKGG
ncbi:phage major capsid protein [Lysinibacillus sp. JNUCC 51]|uniref:phage major capsid protein n=1 Tax=Lysinibacillus sp. JNUCC-51 TaxID=2792479 RepID=UPI001934C8E4|nr:phage major capsid protein [Lysinibacillus sp. JNUCC-51]